MAETAKPKDIWAELRKPFPKESVGKLPRGGIQVDYVGHAAVTDRLNTVDPTWSWEPMAYDERGLPAIDEKNGLWIRLTIGSVTRIGYGDGPDNKQRIGDAIRNAAMRFGVALDLWSKDELESNVGHPEQKNLQHDPFPPEDLPAKNVAEDKPITPALKKQLGASVNAKGFDDIKDIANIINNLARATFEVESVGELTEAQATQLLNTINGTAKGALEMLTEES